MSIKKLNDRKGFREGLPLWSWPIFFLFLWQILLRAQNPGLMSDDSGEMIAASYRLGLPHPPGYPLFCLLGRLLSFIPLGTAAFRYNLLAAALMLSSLWFILDTCRRLDFFTVRRGLWLEFLLMLMGLLFISNRAVFAQCLTAKGCVYALTLLFGSVLIWLGVQRFQPGTMVLPGYFLWAIGMANHWQTMIFWLSLPLLWSCRPGAGRNLKTAFYAFTFMLTGFSLYLYLPLRASLGVLPYWGNPVTLRGFYWVVSRQLVKGSENWIQPYSFYVHSAQWILQTLMFYWLPGFILLAPLGAAVLREKNRPFFKNLLFLFLPVLAAVALVHEERNHYLIPVYLVSLSGLTIVFGFGGLAWLMEKFGNGKKKSRMFFFFLLAASSLGWLGRVFQGEDKSRYTLAGDFGFNVFKILPKNTLFLADGDQYVMPLWYHQFVQGKRTDILFEPSIFLYHDWGWSQLAGQSRDMRKAIDSSNLFTGRLRALTDESPRHPFYYSLDREYLQKVLDQVPGQWVPRGLAYEWMEKAPPAQIISRQMARAVRLERFRGIKENFDLSGVDPSTGQIYRYYAFQYYLTAQFLGKLSTGSPKTPK